VLRKHRHQAQDERKLAVVAAGKVEAHVARRDNLGLVHLEVVAAQIRPPLLAHELPGKEHILRRDRFPVRETRRWIDPERHETPFGIGLDRLRDQPVKRERLVVVPSHEAFDDVAANEWGRDAFDDERV
jgi:hypothetical protein